MASVILNEGSGSWAFEPLRSARSPLARAEPISLDRAVVESCLDLAASGDRLFERAWRQGCSSLDARERATVAGVTGHVAESVVEVVFADHGWFPIWHHIGPGRHGVDLAFLSPGGLVVIVEVKGTLVPRRIPRLAAGELRQMSAEWVDKHDNPAMASLDLQSDDVYGLVVAVNFPDLTFRLVASTDFSSLEPVAAIEAVEAVLAD